MSAEEIKSVIEVAISNSAGLKLWQMILLGVLAMVGAFLGTYVREKAKGLATKQDVQEITTTIENVKRSVEALKSIDTMKYKLKYDACIQALSMIDAHYSHTLVSPDGTEIRKQYASTKEARECHSKLILSCESTILIEKFDRIMFGPRPGEDNLAPTDLLNEFRNLVRKELGFGTELTLDRERAWFGKIGCEEK